MKTIWLALHNVIKIYKKHLFVFVLIIVSMSTSTFGVLFYSGYIGETCVEREVGNGDYLRITLAEESEDKSLINMLDTLVMNIEQLCRLRLSSLPVQEVNSEVANLEMESEKSEKEIGVIIIGEYNKQYSNRLLIGRNLTYEETEAVGLIPSDFVTYLDYDDVPINTEINFEKNSVQVVGVLSYMDEDAVVVPIKYYINNFSGKYLEIGCDRSLSKEERLEIDDILMDYNIIENYNWVLAKSVLLSWDFWIEFLQILMIFIVIIINIFVIIYFLMLRMKQTYSIYLVCGGGSKKILFIITLQVFLIMLIGILLGGISFLIFWNIAKSLNLVYKESLFFYVTICTLISVISLFVSVIMCNKVNHNITVYRTLE